MTAANKALVSRERLERHGHLGQRLVERIGNTPLLRLGRARAEFPNVEICAKAEWFNPGGSVKDRAAYSMIREGERQRRPAPGKGDSGRDQRQHGNRVRHDRRGARVSRKIVPADQRVAGAEADSGRRTVSKSSTRPATKEPTARFGAFARFTTRIRRNIFIPISTVIPANPAAHYDGRRRKSGSKREGRSRILSRGWARAERLWAPRGG